MCRQRKILGSSSKFIVSDKEKFYLNLENEDVKGIIATRVSRLSEDIEKIHGNRVKKTMRKPIDIELIKRNISRNRQRIKEIDNYAVKRLIEITSS